MASSEELERVYDDLKQAAVQSGMWFVLEAPMVFMGRRSPPQSTIKVADRRTHHV